VFSTTSCGQRVARLCKVEWRLVTSPESGTLRSMQSAVRLLAFAGARDVLGAAEIVYPLAAPCTAAELLEDVCRTHPALLPWRGSIRVAVNGTYASGGDPVASGDEVALIPPVAGG
jgi:molybdopterin synthase catalytic subunit/molybdopterin synthase sulfur carrier subunit